jgi:hypothetical protein
MRMPSRTRRRPISKAPHRVSTAPEIRCSARKRRISRFSLESLEDRTLLANCANPLGEIWREVADSPFMPDFLNQALTLYESNTARVSDYFTGTLIPQVEAGLAQAGFPVDVTTDITFGIGIEGEIGIGPDAAFLGVNLNAVEVGTGYNLTLDCLEQTWKLSRAFEGRLVTAKVAGEYFAKFPSLLNVHDTDQITFGVTLSGGAEVKGQVEGSTVLGLIAEGEAVFGPNVSITAQTTISVGDFLANYAHQSSFHLGLADVFIPYFGNPWWQDMITRAASFIPVVGLGQLLDVAFTDSPLGILAASGDVTVRVTAGLPITLAGWGGVGAKLPALFGEADVKVKAGIAVTAGVEQVITEQHFGNHTWRPQTPKPPSVEDVAALFRSTDARPTGVTIVTHGFQTSSIGGDSLLPLAQAIHARAGGWLLDYDVPAAGLPGYIDPVSSSLPQAADAGRRGEVVLVFDWAAESGQATAGWGEAAGDALFSMLIELGLVDPARGPDNLPLHFIGHSFGTAVTSEAIERLAAYDVPVDQVTYLDPHDFQQVPIFDAAQRMFDLGEPFRYGASVWNNVAFADVYYETRGLSGEPVLDIAVPRGRPIPGAYNQWLVNELPANPRATPNPNNAINPTNPYSTGDLAGDHSYVWNCFYAATVLGSLPAGCAAPAATVVYASTGYAFSRVARGQSHRPAPVFVGASQDHRYDETPFLNRAGDTPLSPADVTQGRWAPNWDPTEFVNGDFEHPANNFRIGAVIPVPIRMSNIEPGWSHHGGGGKGRVDSIGQNEFLELESGNASRTHNRIYVAPEATHVAFDLWRVDSSPNDLLRVRFGAYSVDFALDAVDAGFRPVKLEIPRPARGANATMSFEIIASADGSGDIESEVRIDNVRFETNGFLARTGDVIAIDLKSDDVDFNFEVPTFDPSPEGVPVEVVELEAGVFEVTNDFATIGTLFLSERVDGAAFPFQSTGLLYFVPGTNLDSGLLDEDVDTPGFQGLLHGHFVVNGESRDFQINVISGYSTAGENAVTGATSTRNVLRLQHRLRFFGFPDSDGNPLALDGSMGPRTRHAIGLFNAAVNATNHDHQPSSTINLDWINDRNAPRWVELTAHPGLEIFRGDEQTERWATSWAENLVVAAAAKWQANATTPHPNLAMLGASLKQGGDTPFHVSHEAGMDIDFETPSTNDLFDASGNLLAPFFAVVTQPGTNTYYVAAQGGGVLVTNAAGGYEAADPNAPGFDWSVALRASDAWDNAAVLDKLRDPNLMASAPGYNLDVVRGQIAAFSSFVGATTPGGVTVESILYNDPRTWDLPGVIFFEGHGGHFHVNVGTSLINAADRELIVEGLKELQTALGMASQSGPLAQHLGLVDQTAGQQLDAADGVDAGLVDPAENYFATDPTPTHEELSAAIEESNGSPAATSSDANKKTHDVTFTKTKTIRAIPIDLGTLVDQLNLELDASATVDLDVTITVDLTFGMDQSPGVARDDKFFVRVRTLTGSLGIDASDVDFSARIGFLGAGVENGTIDLNLGVAFGPKQPEFSLGELRSGPFSALFDVTAPAPAPLDAVLPVVVGLGGATNCASPRITIHDSDIFAAPSPVFTATGFEDLLDFRNISPQAALAMLDQFNTWLSQFRDSPIFDIDIPFTSGQTLGTAFDLQSAFVDRVVNPLKFPDGSPNYRTSDDLGGRLAAALGLNPADVENDYDCSTHDLRYHVKFAHEFNPIVVPIDLSVHAGTIAGLATSATLTLEPELAVDLRFGINLSSPITDLSITEDFFVKDVFIMGTVTATASDIDASAQLGSLGIAITDGTASVTGDIAIELKDPGTQGDDGRISLGELIDGLGDTSTLVYPPDTHITASFSLPVMAEPFHLGGATVDLSGLVSGTDASIDFTLTAGVAGTIVDGLVIEPLPNGDPSTVTFTKGEGLKLHARARILGVPANLDGAIAADGDFSFAVSTDDFNIGTATVRANGTLFRVDDLIGWNFTGSVSDWKPVPFLTVERLDVTIDPTRIGFETTTAIAGVGGIHLTGNFLFADRSYEITADAETNWEPVSGVHLTHVLFGITNRNAERTVRVTAQAELDLFGTEFIVSANVTSDGEWIAAQPLGEFQPIPGLTIHDISIVATTYELVLDVGTIPATELTNPPAQLTGSQRRIPIGVNLVAAATLPENIPAVGGSEVQIAGHIGTSLAELSIEAKLVLAHPPEIAGLFAFDAVGLRITGTPSLTVFGQGRVLHDRIPSLEQDVGVEAALTLDIAHTTLSGSLSLLQPADGSPPISNLFGIDGLNILEGDGEFGINFATTPLPLPTIGFNLVAELPEFAVNTLSLPPTIGAALNISTTEPIFAVSVLDWRPFHVLGVDNVVIDEGSIVAAPNGGSIGTKVFPRGFSAEFEADILGTHVSYVGVFNEQTQGIIMKGSVSTTRVAGVTVGGPGCDGVAATSDDGACFAATYTATNPLENRLTVDFTIDLPGPAGVVAVHGELGNTLMILDATVDNWRPISGLNFDGSLHAEIVLRTVNLELDFDLTATILGTPTHFVGTMSASQSGFTIFATATIDTTLVDIAATIDIGANSPFAIGLAADFTLPGARPGHANLAGELGASGVELNALVDNWQLVPGLSFDGTLEIEASLQASSLIVSVDVNTYLLGTRLDLEGTIRMFGGSVDLDLSGSIQFGGTELNGVALDLDVELVTDPQFRLDFHGKLELFAGFKLDVTADVRESASGFIVTVDARADIPLPNLDLGALVVDLQASLTGSLSFGSRPSDFAFSLGVHGRACVTVEHIGSACTDTVSAELGFDGVNIEFPKWNPHVHKSHGIPTRVHWHRLQKPAADTSEPRDTVTATCTNPSRRFCDTIEVRGSAAPEFMRAYEQGTNVVVQAQNSAGEWVTLLQRPKTQVTALDVDMRGGNDSVDLNVNLTLPGARLTPFSLPAELRGGTGRDVIRGGTGPNTIFGGTGGSGRGPTIPALSVVEDSGDELNGNSANDSIFGEGGNDIIIGGGGINVLNGGGGVNLIDGRLEIRGTDRPERISIIRDVATEEICLDLPVGPRNCFTRTTVDDLVVQSTTGPAPAITLGRIARDRVTSIDVDSRGGNDRIEIAPNITIPSVLHGGAGHDAIQGGGATDSVFGDAGIDLLIGGPGDALDGGPGANMTLLAGRFDFAGTANPERIDVIRIRDVFQVRAVDESNGETATFQVPLADVASVHANLGGGDDTIIIAAALSIPAEFDLGPGNDHARAGSGPTTMHGDDGDDELAGGPGNDVIFGEADDDVISCGGGADEIDGGPGVNSVNCGGNHPPAIDPISDYEIDEGSTLSFTVTASDPDTVPGDGGSGDPPTPTFVGPVAYLSAADSPFVGSDFAYFHLEDFEDGVLSVPGVAVSAGVVLGPEPPPPPAADEAIARWKAEGNADNSVAAPRSFVEFNGHFYGFTTGGNNGGRLTWGQAGDEAGSLGGSLVVINDAAEQDFLVSAFLDAEQANARPYWIGLRDEDSAEQIFRWHNGDPVTYTNWNSGEPDDESHGDSVALNWHFAAGTSSTRGTWINLPNAGTTGTGNGSDGPYHGIIELEFDPNQESHGSLKNGVAFATGIIGQSFLFDGLDDEVVVPHSESQNTGDQLTIEAWVRPTSSGHGRPIAQKRSTSNVGGYTFETTHAPSGPDNGLQFVIWVAGSQRTLQTPANVLTIGAWQHVAATFDDAEEVMRIYVNGVEQASASIQGTIDAVTEPVVIGRNVVIPSFAWQGQIDELGLYNRALSESEVRDIFQASDANPQTVYREDFESAVGSEWSSRATDTTPVGSRKFLGQFGNETVSLSLGAGTGSPLPLPSHSELTISFDLFVIRTWDGNGTGCHGPDVWDLSVANGPTLLHTTFNNPFPGCESTPQAFPDAFPGGSHPFQTGASEVNTLGFTFPGVPGNGVIDSVYNLSFTFPHSASSVTFDFKGMLSTPGSDESWGLDNVSVSLGTTHAQQTTYAIGADFSRTTNPGGAWSYGWSSSRGSEFHLYPHHYLGTGGSDSWDEPAIVALGAPAVAHNGTGSPISALGRQFLPGQTIFHPGQNGENSVIRWTAPVAGQIDISAAFTGYDSASTDVAVLHDFGGSEPNVLFGGDINGEGDRETFATTIDVAAGDTIDFTVGQGGNGFVFDSTLIDATITLTTDTPPDPGPDTPDSVDGDDGSIDGDGSAGRSFRHTSAANGITFTFDPEILGGLPTHVGIVWTDGGSPADDGGLDADISFEAFDADGNSLGVTGATDLGDADRAGGTAEDRFFGVVYMGGISMIRIRDNDDGPIEVDHLQYGRIEPPAPQNQPVTYSLAPGAPVGATIDPQTGVFTWTPTEAQGPNDYSVTVRVNDNAAASLGASRTFRIAVNEINEPPVLGQLANHTIAQGETLRFTALASDPDQPAHPLEFTLDGNAPAGATIDAHSGEFTWKPVPGIHSPGAYSFAVLVTDRGSPALSDSQTVVITVIPDTTPPTIDRVTLSSNDRFVTQILLSTSELLDPARAAQVSNYRIVTAGRDGRFGTSDDVSSVPASATYDPAAATIALGPGNRLPLNQLFEIVVTSPASPAAAGVTDVAGNALDGDRNAIQGGNYTALLARGNNRLTYLDRTGDTVTLTITRGIMDLLLGADGEAVHLSLHDGPGASSLTGRVRTRGNAASTTTIRLVTGMTGIQSSLPPTEFRFTGSSSAAIDELLAAGELF